MGHIDGSSPSPPPIIVTTEGKESPNPAYSVWHLWRDADQKALLLINASLSEEAAAEVLGLTVAHFVWLALENAYILSSEFRISVINSGKSPKVLLLFQNLVENSRVFVTNYPLLVMLSMTWTKFIGFFAAWSHEMFLHSLHGSVAPQAAFSAQSSSGKNRGAPFNNNRVHSSGGKGCGKRPPHCQLCRKNGHYANQCPNLASFASQASPLDANLAQAFQAQCHVTQNAPDWYVNSGATAHMTPSPDKVNHAKPYMGDANVTFGNGNSFTLFPSST
ncbi:hypothetical protein Lser_V15G46213 [Lactuca serriola]